MKFDNDNLFQAAREEIARDGAARVIAAQTLQSAMDRYLEWRGIGESAVDLIPREIRQPCGPIRTNEGMYWTHTPGILKLTAWFVRLAWGIRP